MKIDYPNTGAPFYVDRNPTFIADTFSASVTSAGVAVGNLYVTPAGKRAFIAALHLRISVTSGPTAGSYGEVGALIDSPALAAAQLARVVISGSVADSVVTKNYYPGVFLEAGDVLQSQRGLFALGPTYFVEVRSCIVEFDD